MKNQTELLIEHYSGEAMFLGEVEDRTAREVATKSALTVQTLRAFRDTLISIARCQNGLASHQAQDVLKELGYCDHSKAVFHAAPTRDFPEGWYCADCDKTFTDRLVPYT